jgi:predicted kinase
MSLSLSSCVRVNQDELGSLNACLSQAKQALRSRQSVVVDNTNLVPQTRQTWIALAKEMNVQVSLFPSIYLSVCLSRRLLIKMCVCYLVFSIDSCDHRTNTKGSLYGVINTTYVRSDDSSS